MRYFRQSNNGDICTTLKQIHVFIDYKHSLSLMHFRWTTNTQNPFKMPPHYYLRFGKSLFWGCRMYSIYWHEEDTVCIVYTGLFCIKTNASPFIIQITWGIDNWVSESPKCVIWPLALLSKQSHKQTMFVLSVFWDIMVLWLPVCVSVFPDNYATTMFACFPLSIAHLFIFQCCNMIMAHVRDDFSRNPDWSGVDFERWIQLKQTIKSNLRGFSGQNPSSFLMSLQSKKW